MKLFGINKKNHVTLLLKFFHREILNTFTFTFRRLSFVGKFDIFSNNKNFYDQLRKFLIF